MVALCDFYPGILGAVGSDEFESAQVGKIVIHIHHFAKLRFTPNTKRYNAPIIIINKPT
jgi:hypothetical protein